MIKMNITWLIIASFILFVVALVWTLFIFKQEENKMKKYEEEGDTLEDQLKRSEEYEKRSLSSDVTLQIVIYSVFKVVFFFCLFIYFICLFYLILFYIF